MGDEVRLIDLEVIRRYSLAVRQDAAPAEELLAALDASRARVLEALGRRPGPVHKAAKSTAKKAAGTAKGGKR